MVLQLKQTQAVSELAGHFYDFLPNKPHPYANQAISFRGIAEDLGLARFYSGGSKLPTITTLLMSVLEHDPRSFSRLIREIVQRGLVYRNSKSDPLYREDIEAVNIAVEKVGFKIPELWDTAFLESLPQRVPRPAAKPVVTRRTLERLKTELMGLGELGQHERGPAFERFLQSLFRELKLDPRGSIKLAGEQIDGSFDLDGQTYLVEAKFHREPIGPGPLREFRDKVEGAAAWSRGLFVSWSGFSPHSSDAMGRGKRTNIVGMTGQDLYLVLDGEVTLQQAIRMKARRAAETGEFFVSLQQLLMEQK